jgi:hypothetical protein
MSNTVETIYQQLKALGIPRNVRLVAWDQETLKVSRGLHGALIRYNRATDLYDITAYAECETWTLADGVYAENLLDVIAPALQGAARVTLNQ